MGEPDDRCGESVSRLEFGRAISRVRQTFFEFTGKDSSYRATLCPHCRNLAKIGQLFMARLLLS